MRVRDSPWAQESSSGYSTSRLSKHFIKIIFLIITCGKRDSHKQTAQNLHTNLHTAREPHPQPERTGTEVQRIMFWALIDWTDGTVHSIRTRWIF